MSLFNTIKTGATGLVTSGASLGVIGNNIANINTRGFKKGRIAFNDLLPQTVGFQNGFIQVGRGAVTSGVDTLHIQGGLQSTGSALDVAITGDGFFMVENERGKYFTRNGNFRLDNQSFLTNGSGLRVVGFPAGDDGTISGAAEPLQLEQTPRPAIPSSVLTMNVVLNPEESVGTPGTGAGSLKSLIDLADGGAISGTTPSIVDLTAEADWSTGTTIYDSLGQAHQVTLMFERETGTGASGGPTFNYYAVIDGSELDDGTGNPQGDGFGAKIVDAGRLEFNADGSLNNESAIPAGDPWEVASTAISAADWPGADSWTPQFDWGENIADNGSVRANGNESAAISITQDGQSTSYLTGLAIESNGIILGKYDNGQEKVLGQMALAKFAANSQLTLVGGNLYQQSIGSGDATLDKPGLGGRGSLSGYALESSNVDLEDEFVGMIQSQRSYQANASTVRAVDESIQTLVQLV